MNKGRPVVNLKYPISVALAGALLAGCAGQSMVKSAAKEPDQRALERWQLVIDGKYEQAYDYLSPGARELQTRESYVAAIAARPVTYLGVEPAEKHCDDSGLACTVISNVTFSVISNVQGVGKMQAQSMVEERWINSGGRWYLVPE